MKTILRFMLLKTFIILLQSVNVNAQSNLNELGGGNNELKVEFNNDGTYMIYKMINGKKVEQIFQPVPVFALKIGASGKVFSSSEQAIIIGNSVKNNHGTRQTISRTFDGFIQNGYSASVTMKLIYDTANPDFLIKEATLDLTNVPNTMDVSLAYGFDTYINSCDAGAALTIPSYGTFNNQADRSLTTDEVRRLSFVGCQNSRSQGALMGFFTMGLSFDRAYSSIFNSQLMDAVGFLNSGTGNNFRFGSFNIPDHYCSVNISNNPWDNILAVAYTNIKGGQIVTVCTGLTFAGELSGDLDYFWNNGSNFKSITAGIGSNINLNLNYRANSLKQVDDIAFKVDFPGLKVGSGGCNNSNLINARSNCSENNEYYQLTRASVAADRTANISIPVKIECAGQWIIDINSISTMAKTSPFGSPATLTVPSTVGFLQPGVVNYCGGEQTFTVKFNGNDTALDDVVVDLAYGGDVSNFAVLPTSVTIPKGKNSADFNVKSINSPTNTAMTIMLNATNKVYATVDSSANLVSISAYQALSGGKILKDTAICAGEIPNIFESSPEASGGSGSYLYQWERSFDNITWTAIAGATDTTYHSGALTQLTYFRRKVTDLICGNGNNFEYSNTVQVIVNPLPNTVQPIDVEYEYGEKTLPISFGGSFSTIIWTSSNPAIGLAASGTDSIPSFIAKNNARIPITSAITVTSISASGCKGTPVRFTITVKPLLELVNDSATVQEYKSVNINILGNDSLPLSPVFSIVDEPVAGMVAVTGSGANTNVIYRHTGYNPLTMQHIALTNSIDSFKYKITSGTFNEIATVYVYVLQSVNGGFAYCSGTVQEINLKSPVGHSYFWYSNEAGDSTLLPGTNPRASYTGTVPFTCYIQPLVIGGGYFPPGKLEAGALGSTSSPAKMKWTGLVSNEWNNPDNWVMVNSGFESPASCPPSLCTDVIIPATATKFPELVDTAYCRNIKLKGRAMIKNPHVLKYTDASLDIRLRPSELERFIMWSAPLQDMYSGDYHYYSKRNTSPFFGDVFMNYFQKKNPDMTSEAEKNKFTATFGKTGESLPLGKPFNLKVLQTSVTRDSSLHFPARENSYAAGQTLQRANSSRFITDGVSLSSGVFDLPVNAAGENNAGYDIIQVVNPYLAYLKISDFIAGNSAELSNGYYIWNGNIDNSFTTYAVLNKGNRYVSAGFASGSSEFIPPLQSFFVTKNNPSVNVSSLKMSPDWTTTSSNNSGPYRLRSTAESGGVLNIKVSQEEKRESHASLIYIPGASGFMDRYDMPVLVFEALPLIVYTFSITKVPLAINSSSTFDMYSIPLGLRVRDAGETKLEFEGLETFGYNVVLIDKLLNKMVNLMVEPTYTFMIAKQGNKIVEINDRFILRMSYTGKGLTDNEETKATTLQVTGGTGYINVKSNGEPVESIQVYDSNGRLVYNAANLSVYQHNIYLSGQHVYMVIAKTGKEVKRAKAYVK